MSQSYTNDQIAIDWPEFHGDEGEIFDYILRHGPVRERTVREDTPFMSPDGVSIAIEQLVSDGLIKKDKTQNRHGVEVPLYYVPKSMEVDDGE